MKSNHPNFLQNKIWLFDWLRHSSFRGSPPHIIPSNKVNNLSRIPLLCQIYDFSKHDHQILLLFYIQLNLYFGLEMIYHCIPYIFLNKRTINKSMALLFAKATMIGCKIGFLICTLNRSTPYPFSKSKYILLTSPNPSFFVLQNFGVCYYHHYCIVYYYWKNGMFNSSFHP